jgi:hypothetical protein
MNKIPKISGLSIYFVSIIIFLITKILLTISGKTNLLFIFLLSIPILIIFSPINIFVFDYFFRPNLLKSWKYILIAFTIGIIGIISTIANQYMLILFLLFTIQTILVLILSKYKLSKLLAIPIFFIIPLIHICITSLLIYLLWILGHAVP